MTLVSGSKMMYIFQKLSFENLCTILRYRASLRGKGSVPTVYFDVSWLGRKLSTASSTSVPYIFDIAVQFVDAGINLVLALDN